METFEINRPNERMQLTGPASRLSEVFSDPSWPGNWSGSFVGSDAQVWRLQ
jgi:hypothetical protein